MKKYLLLYKILFLSLPGFAQLNISTGARLVASGNVSINIQDLDLKNDGSFTPSTSKIIFSGVDGNFIGGSSTTTFNQLEIAKTNNTLALFSNVNVNGRVNFVSGMIDLNLKTMTLGNAAVLNNENENSRITGLKGGEVVITTNMNKPSNLNPGNLGAIISSSTNMGAVVVRRGHKEQAGSGLTGSINRYYSITSNGKKAANATIRLKYFDAELNGQDETTMTFYQSLNNGGSWTDQSFSSRDAAANWIEKTAMSSLGTLTLSNNVGAPIIVHTPNTSTPENLPDMTKKLTVGPNPNNGNFWFKVAGLAKESVAVLYTVDGKIVRQFRITDLQQQQVDGLKTGMYILKVEGLPPFRIVVQADGVRPNTPIINNSNTTKF